MKKITSLLFTSALVVGIFAASAFAQQPCYSQANGYCVELANRQVQKIDPARYPELAAIARAQGLVDAIIPPNADPGDIIPKIYVFALGLVGISALIMFVYAGIMYMTAGDSTDRVGRAKGYIWNATFGLVLALISWLLLYTINPDLTNTLSLKIKKIDFKSKITAPGSTTAPGTSSN